MRSPTDGIDLSDPGTVLLRLASRVRTLPDGGDLAALIRNACLELPFVDAADVAVDGDPAGGDADRETWTHRYEVGPGRLAVVRIRVSDPVGFRPIEPALDDAFGLIGLCIADRHARQAGQQDSVENARLAEVIRHSVNPT